MPVLTHMIRAKSAKPGILLTHSKRDADGVEVPGEPLRVTSVYEFVQRTGRETVLLVFAAGETWPREFCVPASPGQILEVVGERPKRRRAVQL